MKEEIYFSVDIEADGPIPGPHSMLSFAAIPFTIDSISTDIFEANLELLSGAEGHPDTMTWWKTQPIAWELCRKDLQDPKKAMTDFKDWIYRIAKDKVPVFVGYPATFDHMWITWYLNFFTGENPFGFQGLDLKSYASAVLKKPFKKFVKKTMPAKWKENLPPHTHKALDDALEQAILMQNIIKSNLNGEVIHVNHFREPCIQFSRISRPRTKR